MKKSLLTNIIKVLIIISIVGIIALGIYLLSTKELYACIQKENSSWVNINTNYHCNMSHDDVMSKFELAKVLQIVFNYVSCGIMFTSFTALLLSLFNKNKKKQFIIVSLIVCIISFLIFFLFPSLVMPISIN